MKKKLSSVLAVVIAAALLGMTLTACKGSDSSASGGTDQSGNSGNGGEKVTMTVCTLTGGNNQKYAELILDEINRFNEENSYNAELKQEAYSNEQYKTKLTTVMASNAQPDIFFTWESGFMRPFVEGGKIYPIGDKLTEDTEWAARFSDTSVFGPVTFDGKIYAVPNTKQIVTIAYNKKLFAQAGVEVPKTYDEFLKVCADLKGKNITPFIVPCQEAWYAGQFLQQLTNVLGGEKLFDDISTGGVKWNDPQFVKAGEELSKIVKSGYLLDGFLGMTPNEAFQKFNDSQVAMMMFLTSAITMFNSKDNPIYDDIDFFLMPSNDDANRGVTVGSIGQVYSVSSKAGNIDAACAFVKQLSEVRFQQELVNLGQVVATNVKVDTSKVDKMAQHMNERFNDVTVYTPWFDRVFGAGEGVEFNNTAVAIMGGGSPQEKFDDLQQFALDNANR